MCVRIHNLDTGTDAESPAELREMLGVTDLILAEGYKNSPLAEGCCLCQIDCESTIKNAGFTYKEVGGDYMDVEISKKHPDEWNVYKLNDCDWWLARSLDEAKADALISYGGDVTMIDADAKQLSEADLDQLTYLEEYDPKDPVTTTFREQLIEMREHKAREKNPEPEIFASTESS